MIREHFRKPIHDAIDKERDRQDAKFGWIGAPDTILPSENNYAKLGVIMEEVGEVATALLENEGTEALHAELIQVAACCVAWVEADRARAERHTWATVPTGWDVPGSGIVIEKSVNNPGTEVERVYVTFKRYEPFYEVWAAGFDPTDRVPIAISGRGLIY